MIRGPFCSRAGSAALTTALLLLAAAASPAGNAPAAGTNATARKTVRLLAIGNSFSQNATEYLRQVVESQGNTLVLGQAAIGGCPLEKHWNLAQKHEANPDDPEGKPYTGRRADGHDGKMSLKELLQAQAWDVVTIQQQSWDSRDLGTYRPYAGQLSAYIRQHAPQSKLWVHETWAYRSDHPLLKKGRMTPEQMYQSLHDAYATIAGEVHAEGIMPVGTAFQNARDDPRWKPDIQKDVDPKALKYPELPRQVHALCAGWRWDTKGQPPTLGFDGKHCTPAGKYLAALVWYEVFFGDLHGEVFVPKDLPRADAALLREIAHKTVREGLRPQGDAAGAE